MSDAPHRKIEVELTLSGDSWRDIQSAFSILEREIAINGELSSSSISDGYSTGWILTSKVDEKMTHEIWETHLETYLAELKATSRAGQPSPDKHAETERNGTQ